MAGDRDSPDRDFICQSNPRSDCVLEASRPDRPVFADFHFYFHPALADTHYAGSIQIGSFGANSQDLKPDLTVKAGDEVGNHSVVGLVTDRPGTYTMAVSVNSTAADGSGVTSRIREDVSLVVK